MAVFKSLHDGELCISVESTWSNDAWIGLKGWILSKSGPVDEVIVSIGDDAIAITEFQDRADVLSEMKEYFPNLKCGFQVQLSRKVNHYPVFTVRRGDKSFSAFVECPGESPVSPSFVNAGGLFSKFQKIVNDEKLHVLEIGSRIVSPGSSSKRSLFESSASYTGFDYYPDSNTDVVGDAHKLSNYFDRKFDAIFSISVFEHLAMPWKVALEINKLLNHGGISFHATHFSWPLHDQPWDFYRFSDNGLRNLFCEPIGFQVIECGYWGPLRMHLDNPGIGQELFPLSVGYGGVGILSKKFADYDEEKIKWDIEAGDVVSQTHYPLPKKRLNA